MSVNGAVGIGSPELESVPGSSAYSLNMEIYQELETKYNVRIPTYVLNVLKYSGFDNTVSLAELEASDFDELERFVREELPKLVPAISADFFGVYWKQPADFRILIGHKKLILSMAKMAREIMSQRSLNDDDCTIVSASSQESLSAPRPIARRPAHVLNLDNQVGESFGNEMLETDLAQGLDPGQDSTLPAKKIKLEINEFVDGEYQLTEQSFDSASEGQANTSTFSPKEEQVDFRREYCEIKCMIKNWTANFLMRSLITPQYHKYTDAINRIGVTINREDSTIVAYISCFLCDKLIKALRMNATKRWCTSNYNKHIKIHYKHYMIDSKKIKYSKKS